MRQLTLGITFVVGACGGGAAPGPQVQGPPAVEEDVEQGDALCAAVGDALDASADDFEGIRGEYVEEETSFRASSSTSLSGTTCDVRRWKLTNTVSLVCEIGAYDDEAAAGAAYSAWIEELTPCIPAGWSPTDSGMGSMIPGDEGTTWNTDPDDSGGIKLHKSYTKADGYELSVTISHLGQ